MNSKHVYTLNLNWTGKNGVDSIKNDRIYEVSIPGKPVVKGSADSTFHGDPKLLNPEDMLLSALCSCHMMSYFYICRKESLKIISYEDNPLGELELKVDGSGRFSKVTLNPTVTIAKGESSEKATALHQEAKKLCFIANSCNFLIEIKPLVSFE